MKNHKAMQHEMPQRGIKNNYNDSREQRLFKIVDPFENALRLWACLKMKFRVMIPPLLTDFSMLVPILNCLCLPDWLSNEMAKDWRVEMLSLSYLEKKNQDEEDIREEKSRKLKKQESPTDHVDENRNAAQADQLHFDNRRYFDELGLEIVEIERDGNCMFRALADQLHSDQELHVTCRLMVVIHMMTHPQDFKDFYEGNDADFQEHCRDMAIDGVWGDNLELQAASLVLKTNIHLYVLKEGRIEVTKIDNFHDSNASTMRLSYHNGSHYNSLRVKTEEGKDAQHVREEKGEMNDTNVTAVLANYPGIEKHDQNILRLVLKETIGTATVEEGLAALQLHNWNPGDAIEYLLETAVERLAKGLVKEKLSIDGPPLLSSPLPYPEEYHEDTLGMANSPRIQEALNGDLDGTHAGTQETGQELERERIKDQEESAEKLKKPFESGGSTGDNSVKDMLDNLMPDSTSILPETGMEENKEFNLECKAVDDNKEPETNAK